MEKYRVWVDGQCFQTASNVRGIGRYVSELLSAFHKMDKVHLIISLNGGLFDQTIAARQYLEKLLPGVEIHVWYGSVAEPEGYYGYSSKHIANARVLVEHINNLSPDVALSPSPFEGLDDHSAPLLDLEGLSCPTACVFHDAIPHRFPERYMSNPVWNKGYYRRLLAMLDFDVVFTNSQFTADELADILERKDGIAIGAGLSTSFSECLKIPDQSIQLPFSLPSDYILYVGGMDWRKNLPALISAMALLPQTGGGNLSLVLIGSGGLDTVRALWASLGLPQDGLVTPGNITDAQLVRCYRHARVAVQPSLMEGFGMAALEAIALDCPFLAARGGAVEEILDNPVQTFDGTNAQELADLIDKVLTEPKFAKAIVAAGRERLPLFQWARSAQKAMIAIEQLLATNARKSAPVLPSAETRLVIDVTSTTQSSANTGIQRVVRQLSAIMAQDGDIATVLTYADNHSGWYSVDEARLHAVNRNPLQRIDHRLGDVHFMLDSSWDLTHFHRPRLLDALVLGQDVIHTVYDIGPLTMPAMTDMGMPPCFASWFRFILGHSTGIICISRAVADEVEMMIRAIKLPRRMKIGYMQLGADFTDGEADESWLNIGDNEPFFLMVGTIEPRKGHALVLDAFEQYWASGGKARLVLIGKSGWNTRLLELRLRNHPENGKRLSVHTNVSDTQLRGAYASAHALIMASYLEGFGLPVVEAGRLGCPVILSDLPVFREVAAGAAQADFFSSGDVDGLIDCIKRSLARGPRATRPVLVDWPDWHGTAQQVKDIIFGGKWYKSYEPDEIVPNVVTDDVGELRMLSELSERDRACSIWYTDGPLMSDDGGNVQISVGIRNEGTALWTSNPCPADGLQINVASHVVDRDGHVLDSENARTAIPFAMPPSHDMVFPVRVSTDWLARGAHYIDVMMVQELVARFGPTLRISLNQRPVEWAGRRTTSLRRARIDLLRKPWMVPGAPGYHILLALTNIGEEAIHATPETIADEITVTYGGVENETIAQFTVSSTFDLIGPGNVGLVALAIPEHIYRTAFFVNFQLGDDPGNTFNLAI